MPKKLQINANTVIVFDFETTGLSPDQGDRAIEIGAVKIEKGEVVDRFQSLMNPGCRVSGFIEDYTGISNKMLKTAPPCAEVMDEFADFVGKYSLVAHNASFDRRFLQAELQQINRPCESDFACSMLLARRLYQQADNHQLGTLVRLNNIPNDGTFHRALADAEMTNFLWLKMIEQLNDKHQIESVPFSLMKKLAATPKKSVGTFLKRWAASQ